MAIVDRVKWDGTPDILAWKFPSEDLSTWTQLIVNETQEAFLVRGGVYEGPFGPGRHTLSTENLPLLRGAIALPFGGKTPFSAEVWYVNKLVNLDIKWGTPDPIQLQDPKFKVMIPVRAFGQYGVAVGDSKRFLSKLVGTLNSFDASTLAEYFRGIFVSKIKTAIATMIIAGGQSVLDISTNLDALSQSLRDVLAPEMNEFGLNLIRFNLTSINTPEDDPAVNAVKMALARRAEMEIVGFNYQQQRSFDVLQSAAANEGTSGAMLGAGLGLGMGAAIGAPLGASIAPLAEHLQTGRSDDRGGSAANGAEASGASRIQLLKELGELRSQGILSEDEFQVEKARILRGDS